MTFVGFLIIKTETRTGTPPPQSAPQEPGQALLWLSPFSWGPQFAGVLAKPSLLPSLPRSFAPYSLFPVPLVHDALTQPLDLPPSTPTCAFQRSERQAQSPGGQVFSRKETTSSDKTVMGYTCRTVGSICNQTGEVSSEMYTQSS